MGFSFLPKKDPTAKKRNFLWPRIDDIQDAGFCVDLTKQASIFIVIVTGLLSILALAGHSFMGMSGWGLLDAALFSGLAYGLHRNSLAAAILALLLYSSETLYSLTAGNFGAQRILFLLWFIGGVRGALYIYKSKAKAPVASTRVPDNQIAEVSVKAESAVNSKPNPYPWRRFFAKILDLRAFSFLGQLLLVWTGLQIFSSQMSYVRWSLFLGVIFGLIFETVFIGTVGTTPFKALFGIKLSSAGSKLTLEKALKRTLLSYAVGAWFLAPLTLFHVMAPFFPESFRLSPLAMWAMFLTEFLCLIPLILSYKKLQTAGETAWDTMLSISVENTAWGAGRYFLVIAAGLTVSAMGYYGVQQQKALLTKEIQKSSASQSFPNEPRGFRGFRFGESREVLFHAYPSLRTQPVQHLGVLEYYNLDHQRFWDWDDIVVRFVYFKDRLYNVAVDYAPHAAANQAVQMDVLMISRAKDFYGPPEEMQAPNGTKLYLWRGMKGCVSLNTDSKSLILTDSQLLIEYQAEVRRSGPS